MPRSLGENLRDARLRAGYVKPEDVVEALKNGPEKISRTYIYDVEKIGHQPNAPNVSLSVLTMLADLYGVELGDCFPHAAVDQAEVAAILEPLRDLAPDGRRAAITAMAAFLRTFGNELRRQGSTINTSVTPSSERPGRSSGTRTDEEQDIEGKKP